MKERSHRFLLTSLWREKTLLDDAFSDAPLCPEALVLLVVCAKFRLNSKCKPRHNGYLLSIRCAIVFGLENSSVSPNGIVVHVL